MSENVSNKTWLLVAMAAISIIGIIVIGARWSGIKLPSFQSELDLPIGSQGYSPPKDVPPWLLGVDILSAPEGKQNELEACIVKAQINLHKFIGAISSPTPLQTKFCVCARKKKQAGVGFILFWYEVVRTPSGRFMGPLAYESGYYTYWHEAIDIETCDITGDEIVDWLYYDDGKIVGAYSAGYFLKNR
jgi:uncharacterized protein YegJ (DUF2314 family)